MLNRSILTSILPAALAVTTVTIALPAPVEARERATSTQTAVLFAKIVDDTIVFGGDIDGDTVHVLPGYDLVLEIEDTDTHYLYAAIVAEDGADSELFDRNAYDELSEHTFTSPKDALRIINWAVPKEQTAGESKPKPEIKYGPVITVKPKG